MNFKVEPGNFTLLSQEKQKEFELSGRGKKYVDTATKEICSYVRNILPGQDIGKIAHESNVDTGLLTFLSNFISSKKEIENIISCYPFLRSIGENDLGNLLKITENEFENFCKDDMGKLSRIWENRIQEIVEFKKIAEVEEGAELERAVNERYIKLFKHFNLPRGATGKEALRNHGIRYPSLADEIIEYCEQEGITGLGYNGGWNNQTPGYFLTWYAENNNLSSTPDSLASIGLHVGIEF